MRNSVTIPNTTEITVTPGFALPCSHVIHTTCCPWNKGTGEAVSVQRNYAVNKIRIYKSDKHETLYYADYALLSLITCEDLDLHSFFSSKVLRKIVQRCLQKGEVLRVKSIAFPVIGTGNLNFPRNTASRIMLEEVFRFCQVNGSSSLKDIRFVVYQKDQLLVTAFKHEIYSLKMQHGLIQKETENAFLKNLQSKLGISTPASSLSVISDRSFSGHAGPIIEVINGDMTKEKSDAIVNLISPDMNMNNAGELSKAILREGGQQIQQECKKLGKQIAGSAVMTTGGNLAARHVIHIIPGLK